MKIDFNNPIDFFKAVIFSNQKKNIAGSSSQFWREDEQKASWFVISYFVNFLGHKFNLVFLGRISISLSTNLDPFQVLTAIVVLFLVCQVPSSSSLKTWKNSMKSYVWERIMFLLQSFVDRFCEVFARFLYMLVLDTCVDKGNL